MDLRALVPLVFLLACHSVGGVKADDTGPIESDADTDADADGDTDADADADGDTDTDADTDADADADTDDGPAGHYEGEVWVELQSDWHPMECQGMVEIEVADDGDAEGWADCDFWGHWAVDGDIEGEVSGGSFSGTWLLDLYGHGSGSELWPVGLDGSVSSGHMVLELHEVSDWYTIDGEMEAERVD